MSRRACPLEEYMNSVLDTAHHVHLGRSTAILLMHTWSRESLSGCRCLDVRDGIRLVLGEAVSISGSKLLVIPSVACSTSASSALRSYAPQVACVVQWSNNLSDVLLA